MDICKVTIFKHFQELFQNHYGFDLLEALEMHFKHFKSQKGDLRVFKADGHFPDVIHSKPYKCPFCGIHVLLPLWVTPGTQI